MYLNKKLRLNSSVHWPWVFDVIGRAAKCFILRCKPKSTLLMPGMWSHRFQAPWSLLILPFDRFPHQHNAITARDFRWPFYHPAIICWARLWRSLLISESSRALTWRSSSSHCGVNLCGYFVVVLILTQLGYCLNHSFSSDWCNRFPQLLSISEQMLG